VIGSARSRVVHDKGLRPRSPLSSGQGSPAEDAARNREDKSPTNIAVIRRRALDVARFNRSTGLLTAKLKRAGWNDEFMLKLLSQMR
jgi:hypothetical protein